MALENHNLPRWRQALTGYYEWITPLLLSPARRQTGIMHQAVWAEGISRRADALLHISELVKKAIAPAVARAEAPALVVDLGCGIGGTAVHLAKHANVPVIGITLSPFQAKAANKRAAGAAVGSHCQFVVADYLRPPVPDGAACVYALESFCHCPDPARFFGVVGGLLRAGGLFVLFDFAIDSTAEIGPNSEASVWLDRFRQGWRLGALLTAEEIKRLAGEASLTLIDETDLSNLARRRSDLATFLTKPMVHLPVPGPIWGALAGATAGEVCLREGWLKCKIFVFEKVAIVPGVI